MSGGATEMLDLLRVGGEGGRTLLSDAEARRSRETTTARLLREIETARRYTYEVPLPAVPKDFVVVTIGEIKFQSGRTSAMSFAQTKRPEALAQSDFRELASSSPDLLAAHVTSGALRPAQLTFAAEALGDIADRTLAEVALFTLLASESALVREGAVYGLAKLGSEAANDRLRQIAQHDPSPGVRDAAADALTE